MKQTGKLIPIKLRCEYAETPIGMDIQDPRFSWQLAALPSENPQLLFQASYHLVVSSSESGLGDVADFAEDSQEQNGIVCTSLVLESRKRYWWTVRVKDAAGGWSGFAPIAWFETGIAASDWQGIWIGAGSDIQNPLFRKTFSAGSVPVRARIYLIGLGYYQLFINGVRVGCNELAPARTDYDARNLGSLLYPYDNRTARRVCYNTYDVTDLLVQGQNAVGVSLGNGWYWQSEKTTEGQMQYDHPKLLLQLHVGYPDGSHDIVVSGTDWRVLEGPAYRNNIFNGEYYDSRMLPKGWADARFDDRSWEAAQPARPVEAEISSQFSVFDRVVQDICPVKMVQKDDGRYIFDYGKNITGVVRLQARGARGHKLVIRYAESLDIHGDIDFSSTNVDFTGQIQTTEYIFSSDETECYEPAFVWYGFRYIEVAGLLEEPENSDFTARQSYTSVEDSSQFSCSDDIANQVFDACKLTQTGNLHGGIPSDCPHRERNGYTGDGQVWSEAGMLGFDMAAFYTKWQRDILDAQNPITGFVPHTAPFNGGGGGVPWGSAAVIIPYNMYRIYGDRRIIRKSYQAMSGWVDYVLAHRNGQGIIDSEEDGSWALGDWSLTDGLNIFSNLIEKEYVCTFYLAYTAQLLEEMAAETGHGNDAERFAGISGEAACALADQYFDHKAGHMRDGYHGYDAFALSLRHLPDNIRRAIVKNLPALYGMNCPNLDTGISGTRFLFPQLCENGLTDVAWSLFSNQEYPGFPYMILNGATTIWENWQSDRSSFNHPAYTSINAWLLQYIAGISPHKDGAGFSKVVIAPHMPSSLGFARASLDTIRGRISAAYERTPQGISVTVSIPPNVSAELVCPDRYRLENGNVTLHPGVNIRFMRIERPILHSVLEGTRQ